MQPKTSVPTPDSNHGRRSRAAGRFARGPLVAALTVVAALTATSPAARAGAATFDVAVSSNLFNPQVLNIAVGDSVRWTNAGGVHNVDADDGSFRSGDLAPPPWTFTHTFNTPGTFVYHCDLHGAPGGVGMSGTIVVTGGSGAPGGLRFSSAAYEAAEGTPNVTITVERFAGDDGAVSVDYATANGSAQSPGDYGARSGTLSWPDGDDNPRTFTVPINDDSAVEGDQSFTVGLSNPTGGATVVSPGIATVTIRDNDTEPPPPVTECIEDAFTHCLLDDRFQVRLDFATATTSGAAQTIPLTDRGGLFYFSNAENPELLVKMLDACTTGFNSFWVFYAATTNLEFELTVTDTETGTVKSYFNPLRNAAPPVQDTQAFETCP